MIACIPANLNAISLTSAASLSTNDLGRGQESISTRAVIYTNWPQTSRLVKEGNGGKKKICVDLDPWACVVQGGLWRWWPTRSESFMDLANLIRNFISCQVSLSLFPDRLGNSSKMIAWMAVSYFGKARTRRCWSSLKALMGVNFLTTLPSCSVVFNCPAFCIECLSI